MTICGSGSNLRRVKSSLRNWKRSIDRDLQLPLISVAAWKMGSRCCFLCLLPDYCGNQVITLNQIYKEQIYVQIATIVFFILLRVTINGWSAEIDQSEITPSSSRAEIWLVCGGWSFRAIYFPASTHHSSQSLLLLRLAGRPLDPGNTDLIRCWPTRDPQTGRTDWPTLSGV